MEKEYTYVGIKENLDRQKLFYSSQNMEVTILLNFYL